MPILSEQEFIELITEFLSKYRKQIQGIAAASRNCEPEDVKQNIIVFILQRGKDYKPELGSFSNYVLGHIQRQLLAERADAHSHAVSIDDEDEEAENPMALVQIIAAPEPYCERQLVAANARSKIQIELYNCLNGESSSELAEKTGLTKRRVNQVFSQLHDPTTIPEELLKKMIKKLRKK